MKMTKKEFAGKLAKDVQEILREEGIAVKTDVNTVKKLNDSYEAITVTPEGSNIGVNIDIDQLYKALDNGKTYDQVMVQAVEAAKIGISQRPNLDISSLSDYSQMKKKLTMEIVSAEASKEMLRNIPHQSIEDMAVVYRFILSSDDGGRASTLITNQLIENMGVTPEQLHADAMEFAPKNRPVTIKGISEVIAEEVGIDPDEILAGEERLYVATNKDKLHGASALVYPGFLKEAAKKLRGSYYILPSSIHEILLVPDNGEAQLDDLKQMVVEVNATQVAPADKLTDNVYYYNAATEQLSTAK